MILWSLVEVSENIEMESGPQPLDQLMLEGGYKNNDLVSISQDGLTHKQVSKARKGRRITRRIQMKILNAWNSLTGDDINLDDLFNYRGR